VCVCVCVGVCVSCMCVCHVCVCVMYVCVMCVCACMCVMYVCHVCVSCMCVCHVCVSWGLMLRHFCLVLIWCQHANKSCKRGFLAACLCDGGLASGWCSVQRPCTCSHPLSTCLLCLSPAVYCNPVYVHIYVHKTWMMFCFVEVAQYMSELCEATVRLFFVLCFVLFWLSRCCPVSLTFLWNEMCLCLINCLMINTATTTS